MPLSFRSLVQTLDFTVVVQDLTSTTTQASSGLQHKKAVPCPLHFEYMKSLDCLQSVALVVVLRRLGITPKMSADAPHAAER